MKKLLLLFLLITQPAFAVYTENIPNQCGMLGNSMKAQFQINTYTCDVGYFLPADTLGCRPCPSGYTCSGGTFAYNPTQSQGINNIQTITQNVSNACAANFTHGMVARFVPNTINLNWWDRDTNTAQTTCEYDGSITLPTAPVRPGYTFVGWRLRQ